MKEVDERAAESFDVIFYNKQNVVWNEINGLYTLNVDKKISHYIYINLSCGYLKP